MENEQEAGEPFGLKNLVELTNGPPRLLVQQLGEWGVIPKEGEYLCNRKWCGGVLRLVPDGERNDGMRWYCGHIIQRGHQKKRRCANRVGIRTGTFFTMSHLSMYQMLAFIHCWVSNTPLIDACKELKISKRTAVDWSKFCREVVFDTFLNNKQKLGGVGKVVEIHEARFARRKYHRGHHIEGHWVFGGYEHDSGNVFMVFANDRCDETLLPVIRKWIEPGTTVIGDCWQTYKLLSQHWCEQLTKNHSVSFKDPDKVAHTNAVELMWVATKATFGSAHRKKSQIPGNLARFMFQKRCAELEVDRFVEFLRMAGQMYNPMNPSVVPKIEEDQCTTDTDATDSDAD